MYGQSRRKNGSKKHHHSHKNHDQFCDDDDMGNSLTSKPNKSTGWFWQGNSKAQTQSTMQYNISQQDIIDAELYKKSIRNVFNIGRTILQFSAENNIEDDRLYCNDLMIDVIEAFGAVVNEDFDKNKMNKDKIERLKMLCMNEINKEMSSLNKDAQKKMKPVENIMVYALNGNKIDLSKKVRKSNIKKRKPTKKSMNKEASMYIGGACETNRQVERIKKNPEKFKELQNKDIKQFKNKNKNKYKNHPKKQPSLDSLYDVANAKQKLEFEKPDKYAYVDSDKFMNEDDIDIDGDGDGDEDDDSKNYEENNIDFENNDNNDNSDNDDEDEDETMADNSNQTQKKSTKAGSKIVCNCYIKKDKIPAVAQSRKGGKIGVIFAPPYHSKRVTYLDVNDIEFDPKKVKKVVKKYFEK